MRSSILSLLAILVLLGYSTGSAQMKDGDDIAASVVEKPVNADAAARLFSGIKDTLVEINEARSGMESLPEDDDFWFWSGSTETRTDREEKLKALLDSALETAVGDSLFSLQEEIDTLRAEVPKLQARRRELQETLIDVPESSILPSFVISTRESVRSELEDVNGSIREAERRASELQTQIEVALSRSGLSLSPDEVSVLVSGVTGPDVVKIVSAYQAVDLVDSQLERLLRDAAGDPEAAHRYFAMHTALIGVLTHAYSTALENIDSVYMVRLGAVQRSAEYARDEAENLLSTWPAPLGWSGSNLSA